MSKVIFLAHRNDSPTEVEEILCCANCKNRTYIATYRGDGFPELKCAACGNRAGLFGWISDEDATQ